MTTNGAHPAGTEGQATRADCIAYLPASSLGAELSAGELDALAANVELRRFSKNDILISEGDLDDHLYAIVRGLFSASRKGGRGEERLGVLEPGMLTGELAFLDGLKRTATVRAENDECHVIALQRGRLEALLETHPALVYKVMRAVVRSAHRTVSRMDGTYTELMNYISS